MLQITETGLALFGKELLGGLPGLLLKQCVRIEERNTKLLCKFFSYGCFSTAGISAQKNRFCYHVAIPHFIQSQYQNHNIFIERTQSRIISRTLALVRWLGFPELE